ncbi:extracellular solute-binding protein [Saccharibacillus sp. CPCC 101409]|uniref:ABC transporter substrate-binding protein n=1 Tax=Saccharibacillus sp. CPCC 101409 TaxID=3058041 RepID=UPI0026722DDD|nr:extracellular solute-binding protein [Saccharibacillus sp. CPCC 101409]MDO3409234.1 extracellular solute-binding protein [Saccharibacillus sp. CPCC 101409]
MNRGKGPRAAHAVFVLAALILLSGCFSADRQTMPEASAKGENDSGGKETGHRATLRIGILSGERGDRYYRETYTAVYEYTHPGVKIEIVPAVDTSRYRYIDPDSEDYKVEDPLKELQKLAEQGGADLFILDAETLRAAADNGWTTPLAPFMQRTGESESDFAPGVIDGLKKLGNGELQALTPEFASTALYYNADWFEQNDVKPPEDGMTWEQAFALARAASGEKPGGGHMYGLSFTQTLAEDPLWAIRPYTEPLGLTTFDLEKRDMTVNTPQWQSVWTSLADMTRQGAIPLDKRPAESPEKYDPFGGDLFLGGQTAMTIADSGYAAELNTAAANAKWIPDFRPFEWKTVRLPVHPGFEGIGSGVKLGDTFSISSQSAKQEAAWDFIRFVTGEPMQEMRLQDPYRMPSRLSVIAEEAKENGYRSEAFTELRPAEPIAEREDEEVQNNPQLWQIGDTGKKLFIRVLQEQLPVDRALEQWENDGRKWLYGPFTEDGTLTMAHPARKPEVAWSLSEAVKTS